MQGFGHRNRTFRCCWAAAERSSVHVRLCSHAELSNKRAKCEHTHDRPCVDVVKPEGGSCRSWSLLGHCSVTKSARSWPGCRGHELQRKRWELQRRSPSHVKLHGKVSGRASRLRFDIEYTSPRISEAPGPTNRASLTATENETALKAKPQNQVCSGLVLCIPPALCKGAPASTNDLNRRRELSRFHRSRKALHS